MNITINGGSQQIFEAGSNPVINIEHFSNAETAHLTAEEPEEPAASLCEYILKNEFKPMPEIEKELAAAAKKSSKAMAQYVMRGARLGTLDLHGDDGKTVFTNLQEHFGFTWKYSAWMTYYSTKL